jgi:NCAIR mutase (PurE)-related protein
LLQGFLGTSSDAVQGDDVGADVDLDRASRCGFPEVVYGEGKPAALIVEILRRQHKAVQRGFVTRTDTEQAALICAEFPDAIHNPAARTIASDGYPLASEFAGSVAVVSAGSCDAPVAQEALETLRWMGIECQLIEDVGVAGPHRLLRHIPVLQTMASIVVVAGMEAALPSVIGGHVTCPIIGVPTSVGYGASLGGITALLSMLSSCASNVVTVNVDAGFRGGYAAGLIARQAVRQRE